MDNTCATEDVAILNDKIEITNEQVAEELRDAVAYLQAKGWTQGIARDSKTGKVCMIGAIGGSIAKKYGNSLGNLPGAFLFGDFVTLRDTCFAVLSDALGGPLPMDVDIDPSMAVNRSISDYNDMKGRTQAECEKLMLSVADNIELGTV